MTQGQGASPLDTGLAGSPCDALYVSESRDSCVNGIGQILSCLPTAAL